MFRIIKEFIDFKKSIKQMEKGDTIPWEEAEKEMDLDLNEYTERYISAHQRKGD